MKKINQNQIYFFTFIAYLLVLFSNQYFLFDETLIYGSDGYYYMKISEFSPNFGEGIQYIKGERFIIPFTIGLISQIINVDIFILSNNICYFFFIFCFFIFKNINNFKIYR